LFFIKSQLNITLFNKKNKMLKKRIIACLDVKDGVVIKGVQFKQHEIIGDILELAKKYSDDGVDELVFYDISASSENRVVDNFWIKKIAEKINIPFCVAGGIKTIKDATLILENGADKISINSPAISNPNLITDIAERFGKQCVVVGIDSYENNGDYFVKQYTGSESTTINTGKNTIEWVKEVVDRGAGEIVLNCMNVDGVRKGYDLKQVDIVSNIVNIPVVASGGAGKMEDFRDLFIKTKATGGLAASVFHKNIINIQDLKKYLINENINIRK
jgi:cyclase